MGAIIPNCNAEGHEALKMRPREAGGPTSSMGYDRAHTDRAGRERRSSPGLGRFHETYGAISELWGEQIGLTRSMPSTNNRQEAGEGPLWRQGAWGPPSAEFQVPLLGVAGGMGGAPRPL